jgi:hypothetical protein
LAFFQIIYLDTQACIGKQNHWLVHGTFLGFGMVHESNHRFAKIPNCSKSVKSSSYERIIYIKDKLQTRFEKKIKKGRRSWTRSPLNPI